MKRLILSVILSVLLASSCSAQDSIDYNAGSRNYPGVKEGEVFLRLMSTKYILVSHSTSSSNFSGFAILSSSLSSEFDEDAFSKNFSKVDYKTKRVGLVAYIKTGKIISDYVPVFVTAEEWEKKQKELMEWKKSMNLK